MATFKKGQAVVVKYKEDGQFYNAEILSVGKTGNVKVRFDDKEIDTYSAKDVFDKVEFMKKQKEKKAKESKTPDKKEEKKQKSKIDTEEVFDLENIDESIDNDLESILDGDDVFDDTPPAKEKGKGKGKAVNEDEAVFTDVVDDDNIFADTNDENIFSDDPPSDVIEGLTAEEIIALIKEKGWHKKYALGIVKGDDVDDMAEKVRAGVPEKELAVSSPVVDEDDVFADANSESKPKKKQKIPAEGVDDEGNAVAEAIGDNWFSEGDSDDAKFAPLKKGQRRFWIPRKEKATITFINAVPLTYKEHRVRLEGDTHQLTCYGTAGIRCPLCEQRNRATVKKAFFIIDHTEYYSKVHKKQMKNQIRLFVVGNKQYQVLKAHKDKYYKGEEANWRGLKVEVNRSNDRMSPNSGDIFFIEGVVKKDIFKGEYDKNIDDLKKELKPIPMDVLKDKLPQMENESWDNADSGNDTDFNTED